MKRIIAAFTILSIMMLTSVAGYSNSRDGTTPKMESVYDIKIEKSVEFYGPVSDAADMTVKTSFVVLKKATNPIKVNKSDHDMMFSTGPVLPDTYQLEIPYGDYVLKKYATILPTSKTRFRRDNTLTIIIGSHTEKYSIPVIPRIRKLLC